MEVSALKHAGVAGLHGRSPLLRLQSDERLIALVRRGNHGAFEVLVSRYQSRLLAFCRHMLGSREDAEDVLQEVFAAAFNAILGDDRPINARPWLYRIARNRSLNHLRRQQPIGVDSMDVHFAEHGASAADKVHKREEFRELIADVGDLPETQRTALLLREIDALSYEQIAEAMETTIPSVKSLLVRARVSLAEAAEARQLSCDDVRIELAEISEGLKRRTTPPVRRHLRTCTSCSTFRTQLRSTNKALAAVMPIGFFFVIKQVVAAHLGISAGASGGAGATGAAGAAAGSAVAGSATGGLISAGMSTVGTKAAAGLAAAALVTAGAVEIEHRVPRESAAPPAPIVAQAPAGVRAATPAAPAVSQPDQHALDASTRAAAAVKPAAEGTDSPREAATAAATTPAPAAETTETAAAETMTTTTAPAAVTAPVVTTTEPAAAVPEPGVTQVESGSTALPSDLPATPTPPAAVTAPPPAQATANPPVSTPPATPPATTLPADPAPTPIAPTEPQPMPTLPADPPPAPPVAAPAPPPPADPAPAPADPAPAPAVPAPATPAPATP